MDHQTIPLGIWFSSWTYITVHSFVKAQKMAYLPVVPHKAVAEVSKIGNLWDRLVVVNHGCHSESTDGPKGG